MTDKALLIGINRYASQPALRGCVNDVKNVHRLLTDTLDFPEQNIRQLLDAEATKAAINKQMKWLFKGAGDGDRLLLHFSGHGSFTADQDDDDEGGVDELLCLHDMDFADDGSYILDDELREWTKGLPAGARLVVLLDCCHSGTGTRMLARGASVPHDVNLMATRARAGASGSRLAARTRGATGALATGVAETFDLNERDVILNRFIEPPPEIMERAAGRRKKRSLLRAIPQSEMNHVLLAACRDTQTAADAFIGKSFNGAFSYHLCDALRQPDSLDLSLKQLHERVSRKLSDDDFEQVPQLEGPRPGDTLFRSAPEDGRQPGAGGPPGGDVIVSRLKPAADSQSILDLLNRIVGSGKELTAADRSQALGLLRQLAGSPARALPLARAVTNRRLVYVHGITEHVARFSDPWWEALQPFVPDTFGEGTLDDTRHEVLWSDLVNRRALPTATRDGERREVAQEIRESLRDRFEQRALAAASTAPVAAGASRGAAVRRALAVPASRGIGDLVSGIDDFVLYLMHDAMRAQIIRRFTDKLQELLVDGIELDIISHSWGTVVAYEGLCELEDQGLTAPRVHTFFTVGAALSIPPVKQRLREANRDGRRPELVARWINLDARGDIVGGPLQGRPYQVDDDFPELEPFGCESIVPLVEVFNPSCAHGSYFQTGNDAVNQDIFARFILS